MENFKVQFIGVGAKKAGTSLIFECLKEHPQICGSSVKETDFFLRDINHQNKFSLYKKYFNHCPENQIKGGFSVNYLYHKKVAKKIKQFFPQVKIIVSLRNPLERAYSDYLHLKRDQNNFPSFERATKEYPEIIEKGYYCKHLKNYLELFPRENIKVVIFNELAKNPVKEIQKLYNFLGADSSFVPFTLKKKVNPATGFKWKKLQNIFRISFKTIKNHPTILKSLRFLGIEKIARHIKTLNTKKFTKEKLSPKIKKELYKIYKKDIHNLEKLINKNLNSWKYEQK